MPLSEEAAHRFAAYISQTEPSNIDPAADGALFAFVAWALVHEPEALAEPFAYESVMLEDGITDNKTAYVHTVIATAQRIVDAYERERRGDADASDTRS